jgi:hypothetical protein
MKRTYYIMWLLMAVFLLSTSSCTVDDDISKESSDIPNKFDPSGEYDGVWTIDGNSSYKCTAQMVVNTSGITFSQLPVDGILKEIMPTNETSVATTSSFTVKQSQMGISENAIYYSLVVPDYDLDVAIDGVKTHLTLYFAQSNLSSYAGYFHNEKIFNVHLTLNQYSIDGGQTKITPSKTTAINYNYTNKLN